LIESTSRKKQIGRLQRKQRGSMKNLKTFGDDSGGGAFAQSQLIGNIWSIDTSVDGVALG
jgi:hypothetical protein